MKFHFSLTSFKYLNFPWLEVKFPQFPDLGWRNFFSLPISRPLATMWKLYIPRGRHRLDNSVRSYRVREWNTRRAEEASSPFLPSGARTYWKHTRGRRGLLSFSAIGGPRVLKTREREKRPPLLFFLRAPADTWNTRAEEEASSKGLISFPAFGRPHVLEIFPFALKPSACYAAKPLVLEDTIALRSICLGMHLARIKFVSTYVSELCFEWQITRAEQYAKEAPCISAARARSCSLVHWNKLRERAREWFLTVGTLRYDVTTATRTSKTTIGLAGKTTTLQVHLAFYTFLCRFCATTTWNCLILLFGEDVNKRRRNLILFLHLDMVLRNSTLGGFAYIWQSK